MRRWLLLTLGCWLLLVALSGVVIALRRAQPALDPFSRYHITLCDNTLCFQGIKPGVTPWKEALAVLEPKPSDTDPYRFYFPFEGGGSVLLFSSDMKAVETVSLDLLASDYRPTIDSILAAYGPPCGVVTSDGTFDRADDVALIYRFIEITGSGLDLKTPIASAATSTIDMCATPLRLSSGLSYSRWRGVRPIQFYRAHAESTLSQAP